MVRLPALLLAIFLTGQLWWMERTAAAIILKTGAPMYLVRQTVAGPWWLTWTLLAGAFLASWLSVLRATGYRLVRQRMGNT